MIMSTRSYYSKNLSACPINLIKIANVIYVKVALVKTYCTILKYCVYFRLDVKLCYRKGEALRSLS